MPTYKLTYFNIPGRGELVRFLFHYGGIKFEDDRITFEQWPARKPETPFGQTPVLEIDGVKYTQSMAISRYLANEVKLAGNNNLENLQIDYIVDTSNDLVEKIVHYKWGETDEARKNKLRDEIINEFAPNLLGKLDAIVKTSGGYLALGRLTWADLHFVAAMETLINYIEHDIVSKFSNLKMLMKKVLTIPSIREYVKSRPTNPIETIYNFSHDL